MSLINKMLQDLDQRHAADGSGKATLTQQLRPVAGRKGWQRIMWEVGAGLFVAAGWSIWVLYQISPNSVVTDRVFQFQGKRRQAAEAPQVQAAAPVPVAAAAPQLSPAAAPQSSSAAEMSLAAAPATAPAPAPAASNALEAASADTLKLATEIATPFDEKPLATKPERTQAAASAPAPRVRSKGMRAPAAPRTLASKAQAGVSIDKQLHVSTPAERAQDGFNNATRLLKQGRVAEAIDGYKSTLQQDAGHAPARQALLGLLLENRRIDEAQQFLQEGLMLSPGRSDYAMLLARIQVERGDLQGAHDLLGKYAGSAAGDADYHAFDAALLQRLGRHKEAVAGYQAALRLAPRAGVWWMGMGISLQAEARSVEALEAYRRAKSAGGLSSDLLGFVDQRMKQLQ